MQLSWVGRMRGGDAPESFENAAAEISDRSGCKMHPPSLQRNLDKYILESGQMHLAIWTNTFYTLRCSWEFGDIG